MKARTPASLKPKGASMRPGGAAARPKGTDAPRKSPADKGLRTVDAQHVAAVTRPGDVPAGPPEVAVCGRSNVGKSSLVNALAGRQGLARTSKTPGRTQQIQLFDLRLSNGETLRLVDLPGFGHAKVPGAVLAAFSPMIQAYLLEQKTVRAVVVLQDARRDRDDDAIGFAEWLRAHDILVEVVATKCDQVPKTKLFSVQTRLQREFGLQALPVMTSTHDGTGVTELLHRLRRLAQSPMRLPTLGLP